MIEGNTLFSDYFLKVKLFFSVRFRCKNITTDQMNKSSRSCLYLQSFITKSHLLLITLLELPHAPRAKSSNIIPIFSLYFRPGITKLINSSSLPVK